MTVDEKLRKIVSDPVLYMQSFMKIVDKSGKLVPFRLNPQQKDLITNMEKYNVVLKSRQLGISTLSCAYSLYLALTKPSTHCLLASYSIDSATAIFEKLKQLYYDMPEVLRVPLINNNKKELKFTNFSRITVTTIGQKSIARGSTLAFCHVSEAGFCKDYITKQLLAVEQCLTPTGKIILESTANGMNQFSEIWAKAERGDSMYKPFFYGWITDKVMFKDEYKLFCDRYEKLHGKLPELSELDDDEKALMDLGADLEQIVWRRLKIANSDLDSFHQEFPHTPEVAFLNSGNNVFEARSIQDRMNYIHKVKTIMKPHNLPHILTPWFGRGLNMYQAPMSGEKYFIGVDGAEGVGGDYSAVEVFNSEGVQVCEFKSNTIKPFQLAELINAVGNYYNRGYLVIEKASSGHTCIDKLRNEHKYSNMHKHKEYDQRGNTVKRPGFIMNAKTKPMVIDNFVELFMTNQILINSKDLLSEMKLFQYEGGSMNAQIGFHDDLVIATALALHGMANRVNYA